MVNDEKSNRPGLLSKLNELAGPVMVECEGAMMVQKPVTMEVVAEAGRSMKELDWQTHQG